MSIKNIIKTIISDFHQRGIPDTIPRDISIPLNSDKIITIIGPRRAGKTYLLYQIMEKIEDASDILFINFEDERLTFEPDTLQFIIDAYLELYPEKKEDQICIFFDEIQEVTGWQSFVRRIYDTITKNIFLTGSSAKMLSKEIATNLRGRAISYEVLPLSFNEYLRFKQIPFDNISTKGKARVMRAFEIYLLNGGFPETVTMTDEVLQKTLSSYFDVMLYRDIIERYKITNLGAVRGMLKHLLSQTSREFSINKIFNDFKSQGMKVSKESLYEFLSYFEDAFIVFPVQLYAESARKQTLRKAYTVDTGFARLLSFSLNKDFGRLLESIVYLELRRRGKIVFYFKNGGECDFIIKEKDKIIEAIQVCYEFNNENIKREVGGLQSAMQRFNLNSGIILTFDQQEQIEDNIKVLPVLSWLGNIKS